MSTISFSVFGDLCDFLWRITKEFEWGKWNTDVKRGEWRWKEFRVYKMRKGKKVIEGGIEINFKRITKETPFISITQEAKHGNFFLI